MVGLNLEMLKSTGRVSELRDRIGSGRASLVAQMVKNLLAMQETWVLSLGQENPLEKVMATYSSILPGESHGQSSLVSYGPWGCKELDTPEQLTHTHTYGVWRPGQSKQFQSGSPHTCLAGFLHGQDLSRETGQYLIPFYLCFKHTCKWNKKRKERHRQKENRWLSIVLFIQLELCFENKVLQKRTGIHFSTCHPTLFSA